ncbi:galactosylgalactosylxylosylprotein 3-beta-glucuronosyltransferase I [Fopius arisanus]|uniref:Galactosylgalactosylxylosylprotein 3-beta-glucuronosyltransferase n=1 Tax=Fopius arisanus TaxID=64838 RepID=A0A9R1TD31_9HYME|nr:PREDICTED: galactosylgalactosylxylosylprotein 3-beta-glucuronosyltransferase I [Fopius arisanus]
MTGRAFLIGGATHKNTSMWAALWACSRGVPLFVVLWIFIFFTLVIYSDRLKWESAEEKLEQLANTVVEQGQSIDNLQMTLMDRANIFNRNAPTIFAITPTFARPVQKAELTRLAQTFLHIPNFYWIVVEDAINKTELVTNFLHESGLIYKHLNDVTPRTFKLGKNDPNWKKPRGVAQRNKALKWLRENYNSSQNAVVYFADDDNTYSLKLFKEMERIKVIGVWPVGLVGGLMVERPICDASTMKVTGFNAVWQPERKFPMDMAGFAINLRVILEKKDAWFSYESKNGYQETEILEQMVTRDQLEPLADCCTKVYVWHTRTEPSHLKEENLLIKKGRKSNVDIEV